MEHAHGRGAVLSSEVVFGDGGLADQIQAALARAWDEGDAARHAFSRAAYDPSVSAAEALALLPKNPYRVAIDNL